MTTCDTRCASKTHGTVALMLSKSIAVAIALCSLTGCADILVGTSQTLSVQTKSSLSQDIAGATCQLSNNKGTWFVTTPGSVTIHRSYDAINVACEAPGYVAHAGTADSATKDLAWGNLLFGGLIGAAVDAGTGAAYDYPSLIILNLQPIPQASRATAPTS
jgi:hypothetical protein